MRQLLVAVEALVVEAQRLSGAHIHPPQVKAALRADVAERRSHVPSAHECSSLVAAVALRLSPAWFTERWPRTFGTVQLYLR